MSLSIEDAQNVANMRLKLIQNMQAGKPASHGIDEEELTRLLELVRVDRNIGAAGSGKKASAAGPVIPMDLNEFMKKK